MIDKGELLEDIGIHFGNQLRRLLIDTADTGRLAGLHPHDIAWMFMSVLLIEVVQGADAMKFNQRKFLKLCGDTRRAWFDAMEEDGEETDNQNLYH